MKKTLLLAVAGICLAQTADAQFSTQSINVGSTVRNFRQYLPTGFDGTTEPNLPLVIALHGLGDNSTNFSNVGFQYLADTARFLVVYPNGTLNAFGQNAWNNGTFLSSTADDINFISRIIDSMYTRHHIDLAKVYVTGMSMGGIMTYHTVCWLPERVAAIASVAGTMSTPDITNCAPGRAIPVMHMHGTADGTVPYSSSPLPSLSLVPATISFWQNNNGCTDSSITSKPNLVPGDSITVDVIDYNMCSEPVQLWRENGADHIWPYAPVNDITATIEIWNFFRGKTHPSPSMLNVAEVSKQTGITVAPTFNGIEIKSATEMQEIRITDLQGRNISTEKGHLGNNHQVTLSTLGNQPLLVSVLSENGWHMKKFVLVR